MVFQVLNINKEIFMPNHPDTLHSLNLLALIYNGQQRWKEAEEVMEEAVDVSALTAGTEYALIMKSLNGPEWYYRYQRGSEEVRVVEGERIKFRAKHPITLSSVIILAGIYMSQSRWNESENLMAWVLARTKEVYGADHRNTLDAEHRLAWIYMSQGRWNESETLLSRVLEARTEALGKEHPETLTTMARVGHNQNQKPKTKKPKNQDVLRPYCVGFKTRITPSPYPLLII